MGQDREQRNRRLLRARDAIDRRYAEPLDVPALAGIACLSEAAFIRAFRDTFGETPHRYLQRRRIERAMSLLRTTELDVVDVCTAVGLSSLATFTRTFREVVGQTPAAFRAGAPRERVPVCFEKAWARPSSFGQPRDEPAA
ncbi:MAG: helix-turn-helix domain-containing protein [Frankiales bacterium]|nr:helix-turn-helix domain-containing protein [Frankiales bacterium]